MSDARCDRKLQHKSFFLNQDSASACCRAEPIPLQGNLDQVLEHWHKEHQDLERGIFVSSCVSCWKDEQQGKVSFRQTVDAMEPGITRVGIWIDNVCNHMCSYCSPKFSSTWQNIISKNGQFEMISKSARQNLALMIDSTRYQEANWTSIVDWISKQKDDSLDIGLLGGEPLMQKDSLERLFELDGKSIRKVTITTNLCPPNNKFLKKVLESWQGSNKIEFNASIDASPDWNHVPRHGFDSKKFMQNLDLIRSRDITIKLIHTASVLSIWDLASFLDWVQREQLEYRIYNLNNPRALEIQHIYKNYRDQILSELKDSVPKVLRWPLEHPDPIKFYCKEQYHYLRQYWQFARIDPSVQPNGLFKQWWHMLEKTHG